MLLESTELQVARPWMLHNAAEHGARPTPCLHQQALQKPRCAPKKRTSINWCFFCWKKTPHDYLQEMKRSYDDIICTWFFFFCPFFLNKNLQTKSVDVKLPLYNLEFETHFFAFLPRMQSWPPRRMYKYDQVCLRKCRLRGSKNSKMYPNLEWLVLLVQFSGWYLHHNDPQQTLERGARVWFFLPLAKWAIFFGVMKPTPLDSERLLWWTCDCWCSPLKRAWLEIFANAWFDFFAGNGSISQLGEVGKFIGTQKFRIGNGICDRSQEVIKSTWRPPSKSTNVSSFLVVLRNL